MQYCAALFDMDGVVVDTEQSVTAFWQQLAARHGVTLSQDNFARHVYGRPAESTLDALFSQLSDDERQGVHAAMREYESRDTYRALPGVVPFLRRLRHGGIPMALVTSGGPWKVDAVLEQLGLVDLFMGRVTASDITEGKLHPQCYLLGAEILGVPAVECLVFEDAVSGVEAAVAAGATCIGIAARERAAQLIAAGARYVISDFSQLIYKNGVLDLGNETLICLGVCPGR